MMDNNNWRPSLPNGDPAMDTGDWRDQLPHDSRQKVVNKIMETLKKHLPLSATEGDHELRRIAARFEEKIFSGALNQVDYLRKISMKMLTMETKSQNATGSSSATPAANNVSSMDSIPNNQGNLLPGTLPNNQSQAPQALLSQTMQSNTGSGVTGSTALPSSMPPTNNNVTSVVNQNSSMQNVAGMLQDSSGQHGLSSNMFSPSQRQMLSRPNAMSSQQQQQPPQSAQFIYQQQLQQQLLKQNFQSGNVQHIQQQQQNSLQPNQMHSSQQTGISTSPSAMSSAPLQGLHTNQQSSPQLSAQQTSTQSMLRQHQSSLLRQHPQSQQASGIHQQQTSLPQQSVSPLQQQQAQMMRQQAANGSGIQQKQVMGQNVVGDMQQQHQQRLLNQQNNILNMQQKQQIPPQQQLMSQQNSLQSTHQQPLGNVAGMQQPQQQLLSSQVGNSSLQTNQQSVQHMLSQPTVGLQRAHQAGHGVFSSQGQQSHNQMIPLQSHHQQLGLQQQQSNLLQQDVQQRLQSSGQVTGSLLPPQSVVDQQRQQLYQSQRTLPEMPSSSLDSTAQTESANGVDWQEEVYQKIQTMKLAYLPDLSEINQRVGAKLQQDSLPQQQRSEQFEKLRQFKTMLERMMQFLTVPKINIMPALKDKVANYEKQIINFLNNHRRRPVHQGQMQPMHQQSAQNGQDQSHDSQATTQMQSMSIPGSGPRAQQSSLANMQNNVLSSRPGVSATQQNIPSSIPASSLESGQVNAMNNGQHVAMGSMQQNTSQQVNNSSASAQSGLSTLQSNFNQAQLSSSLLQQQHLKQQQDQQFKQQYQQRQMQQQLLQKQQQQQLQLQARQQGAQSDMNDLSARQGMNVSRGMFQQHPLQGQRATYPLQQLKQGSQLPVTSPQLLPGASPQMTQQHSSPQVDQKFVMSSVNKMGTPLQPANSPFVVPSPSTPLALSPMQVDSEKPSGVSSLSMGNTARQQATGMQSVVQSIAIGTPGISASPLLQEFTSLDGNNLNPSAAELPIERLIRVVKSISPQSLSSGVSDMRSVVTMVDSIAGAAPGNCSRASVGEDLVAMTKYRLQARNFMTQEGVTASKKMKRHTTAMPLSVSSLGGSVGDNYKQFACSETSDLESTATSVGKKARTESEHALLEEIKEINQRLIDIVVEISDDEDADDTSEEGTASKGCEGTTVRLSFKAVSLSPDLKAHLSSTQICPIQPLRLLVPCSYPNGSPSLLDKIETSKENEDLSSKAMARFNVLLRSLSQPMSLKDIAKTWDACARTVICEYAQQFGGGTFSSKYGTWEKFVAAS
ncbi:unnamed protein product [Eruca vesicaria subsp. sativa]|uniref:Mediator complex subunit 15 KIX domain-containing protein n=1 Tax=Eruca vesicaria subsp. sativa TaxID=29727 RepID=A0ABC8LFW4_ERUVS|nr:unnamed protein product [Eruca vesicaria subsp. sativa]